MKLADQSVDREQTGSRGAEEPRRRAQRRRRVPDVVGQPAVAAIDQLRSTGLNPAVEHLPTDAFDQHGVVLAQEPSAEAEVPRGATLAVWVGVPNTTVDQVRQAGQAAADRIHAHEADAKQLANDADAARALGGPLNEGLEALDDPWYAPSAASTNPLHAPPGAKAVEEAGASQTPRPDSHTLAAARSGARRVLRVVAALAVAAFVLARPVLQHDRDDGRPDAAATTPSAGTQISPTPATSANGESPRGPIGIRARRSRPAVAAEVASGAPKRARRAGPDVRHRRQRRERGRPTDQSSDASGDVVAAQPPTAQPPTASDPAVATVPSPPPPTAPPAAASDADPSEAAAGPSSAARAAQQEFFTP